MAVTWETYGNKAIFIVLCVAAVVHSKSTNILQWCFQRNVMMTNLEKEEVMNEEKNKKQ